MNEPNHNEIVSLRKRRRKALLIAACAVGLWGLILLVGRAYMESVTSQGEGIQRMSIVGVMLLPPFGVGVVSAMSALITQIQISAIRNRK